MSNLAKVFGVIAVLAGGGALVGSYMLVEGNREALAKQSAADELNKSKQATYSKKTEEVWVSMRPLGRGKSVTSTPVVSIEDKPFPTIKLRSFWRGDGSELERFVSSAERLRSAKAIVVDVRGNAGGSDEYARRWFADLTSGTLGGTVVELLESDVTREDLAAARRVGLEDASDRARDHRTALLLDPPATHALVRGFDHAHGAARLHPIHERVSDLVGQPFL